jgi:hypothetical protein
MSSSEETSTSSDSSPNTRLLRKMEEHINETPVNTREEMRQKLRQKIMIKSTQRLSRFGQQTKLDNMKQEMEEKKEKEEEKVNKKREKNKLKRKKRQERKKKQQCVEIVDMVDVVNNE